MKRAPQPWVAWATVCICAAELASPGLLFAQGAATSGKAAGGRGVGITPGRAGTSSFGGRGSSFGRGSTSMARSFTPMANCRKGNGGVVAGGGASSSSGIFTPGRTVEAPTPRTYEFSSPQSAYSTLTVPTLDGRTVLVDVIRGERRHDTRAPQRNSPAEQPSIDPSTLVQSDSPLESLIDHMLHTDPDVRQRAGEILAARPEGLTALRIAAEPVRPSALRAVALQLMPRALQTQQGQPGHEEAAAQVRDTLTEATSASVIAIRRAAIRGLAQVCRPPDEPALDLMMGLLGDSDDGVREDAAITLGGWKGPAIDRLVGAFDSDQEHFRNAASQALGLMGADAVPRLVDLLGSPRPPVRYSAASALGDIGRPAREAREPLEKLASADPDQSVRYYARTALVRIQR